MKFSSGKNVFENSILELFFLDGYIYIYIRLHIHINIDIRGSKKMFYIDCAHVSINFHNKIELFYLDR